MKILVVCQHYWPEPFPLTEICEGLASRGHKVHVITDVPNYPMGYIYPAYRKGKRRREERNGVQITRTFTVGRRNNTFFRMLNYFSYAISSTWHVKRMKEEYDVVFANQTSPILMVCAAMAWAKRWKKKSVLYCMDLWPASLAAGGVKPTSPIYRVFARISDRLYKQADRILITSRQFRSYFRETFGIDDTIIQYLPQYAPSHFDSLPPREEKGTVDLVFAGNVGAAQSMPTILNAAALLSERKEVVWHIVGDGSELENAKALAKQLHLTSVVFHGRRPAEEMPQYYSMASAMLVTLTGDPLISMTLPAKVQSYMAAGKPIIAAANGEIPQVLREARCGFCAPAEDSCGLAEAVLAFLDCQEKAELGAGARAYYEAHFTKEMFLDKLEQELRDHIG